MELFTGKNPFLESDFSYNKLFDKIVNTEIERPDGISDEGFDLISKVNKEIICVWNCFFYKAIEKRTEWKIE